MEKDGAEENTNKGSPISPKQNQIHDLLFSREISWQEIIYDLINTEQLDPWDIDIGILTNRYLEKIRALEEEDFFVSSKVLLAAAFLLRIKSEILLSKYLKSIDEILFGKKDDEKIVRQIDWNEVDVQDIPDLIPKSPLPRFRRVTLKELIESLDKAIVTENRRIKKEILTSNALRETAISLPKRRFNPTGKSQEIYEKLMNYIKQNFAEKVSFTELAGLDREERIIHFLMLLNLDSQRKVWLEQKNHFEEFHVWPRELYFQKNPDFFAELIEEARLLEESEKADAEKMKERKKNKRQREKQEKAKNEEETEVNETDIIEVKEISEVSVNDENPAD
ncbi:MAG: segregation/condensation protein A [Candidatus Nanoarchaeia archaeon]|nr:segregation/condensation protein A [Candidatus Nanoarchaeia archaeon]